MVDRRPQILVIEDNPADVDLLMLALQTANLDCDLKVLDDGGEALALVRGGGESGLPDLVILDLNLPKNDGIEILQAMRGSDSFACVPVAVLSSSSAPKEREAIEKLRIQHYLMKPPDLEEFLALGGVIKGILAELGKAPRKSTSSQ